MAPNITVASKGMPTPISTTIIAKGGGKGSVKTLADAFSKLAALVKDSIESVPTISQNKTDGAQDPLNTIAIVKPGGS